LLGGDFETIGLWYHSTPHQRNQQKQNATTCQAVDHRQSPDAPIGAVQYYPGDGCQSDAQAETQPGSLHRVHIVLPGEDGGGWNGRISDAYNRLLLPGTLDACDYIISTQPRYREVSPYLGRFKSKTAIIPCGVDTRRFRPLAVEKAKNSMFFLGVLNRFHAYKGLDVLLEALPQVKRRLGYYREKAGSFGLEGSVEFRGFVP
jgi:glycosyltransferase involved in cell wall biosynthesis